MDIKYQFHFPAAPENINFQLINEKPIFRLGMYMYKSTFVVVVGWLAGWLF
jgi:hypothetical protein